jgi:predicted Abi (CAAX) family protease
MEKSLNMKNNSSDGAPKPIRWSYVVAAIIVIAIVVLAEMFHPRSSRNQIKAYEAQIEAQTNQE